MVMGLDLRSEKAQRLRIRFERGAAAGNVGHLDLSRVWEAAFEAAGLPVSRSKGKRAHARLAFAAGLPSGVTSGAELLDVFLSRPVDPGCVQRRVQPHLPTGIVIAGVWEVGVGLPAISAAVRWADYEVSVPSTDRASLQRAVERLLASVELPWRDTRGEKVRDYDLRPLVRQLRVEGQCAGSGLTISMRLRCDSNGVGRPDQVVKALGLPEAAHIHRTRVILAEDSPARSAWRRRGRYL
jgi:radical SAM-linked protein